MDIRELITKSSSEQRKALLNKEVSAVELTNAVYEQVEAVNDKIGAYKILFIKRTNTINKVRYENNRP